MYTENINIIQKDFSLKKYNTFGIDVSSDFFFAFDSIDHFYKLLDDPEYRNMPRLLLGGGSNILFTKNFKGIVINPLIKGIHLVFETNEYVFLKAFCGESWDDFVAYTVENNYGGIENLSGIPGNLGACPIQNIGAYGAEVKDTITEVETVDLFSNEIKIFKNSDCNFSYRDSIFKNEKKGQFLILNVTFRLTKKHTYNICYGDIEKEIHVFGEINLKNIRQTVLSIRSKKLPDPNVIGNAGSFFKNPVVHLNIVEKIKETYPEVPLYNVSLDTFKVPAGWLIEKCGWKGKRIGDVGVHEKQALVLVNFGNGSGNDILSLSKEIIHSVQEKFQITISPEVNVC